MPELVQRYPSAAERDKGYRDLSDYVKIDNTVLYCRVQPDPEEGELTLKISSGLRERLITLAREEGDLDAVEREFFAAMIKGD